MSMVKPGKAQDRDLHDRGSRHQEKELIRKNISVSRVSKVVKGGKRFSFSVIVVVGDGRGSIGFGLGKAKEVPDAIRKATDIATKAMEKIPLKEGRTLHHDIQGKFGSASVYMRSAPKGTGVIAGGAMRSIFEAMGIKDVVAKALRSTNPHNIVKATLEGLKAIQTPRAVANKRSLQISDVLAARGEKMSEKINDKGNSKEQKTAQA